MSNCFNLKSVNPDYSTFSKEIATSDVNSIIALDIQTKFQFLADDGSVYHEYQFPSDRDIQNCGGYVDKLIKYRSQLAREAIVNMFQANSRSPELPVLRGRSILVDTLLTRMVDRFLANNASTKAKLFDHGCTVAEHYEMLDQMLHAYSNRSALDSISYYGLDISPLALAGARLLHSEVSPSDFNLILSEGSDISAPSNSMDFSMSIGVINHVANPIHALDRLINLTRLAAIFVLWITEEPQGFWAVNHSGFSNYFMSVKDLAYMAESYGHKGSFYFADFMPEQSSTQPNSYVGVAPERLGLIGSYTLVFCTDEYVVPGLSPINFGNLS